MAVAQVQLIIITLYCVFSVVGEGLNSKGQASTLQFNLYSNLVSIVFDLYFSTNGYI